MTGPCPDKSIKAALLEIEATIHQAGWDHPIAGRPQTFSLYLNLDTGEAGFQPEPQLDLALNQFAEHGVPFGKAVYLLGLRAQKRNQVVRETPDNAELAAKLGMTTANAATLRGALDAGELFALVDPRYRFIGHALTYQAWSHDQDLTTAEGRKADRYRKRGRLDLYRNRILSRHLMFLHRDGTAYLLSRRRDTGIVLLDHRPDVRVPDTLGHTLTGGVAHGLGLLVDSVVTEDVPLAPLRPSEPSPAPSDQDQQR